MFVRFIAVPFTVCLLTVFPILIISTTCGCSDNNFSEYEYCLIQNGANMNGDYYQQMVDKNKWNCVIIYSNGSTNVVEDVKNPPDFSNKTTMILHDPEGHYRVKYIGDTKEMKEIYFVHPIRYRKVKNSKE